MERVEMYQEGPATLDEDIQWGFTSRYLSKEEADKIAKKEERKKETTTATEGQK